MAKQKIAQEKSDWIELTASDYKTYRAGTTGLEVKYLNGYMTTPFEQFCIKQGCAKVNDEGIFTITDTYLFSKWIKVRDSVESQDAFKSEEMRRLFPEEQAKHKERFAKLRAFAVSIGVAKKV